MEKTQLNPPVLARHSRRITALTKHLIQTLEDFKSTDNRDNARKAAVNIAYLIGKLQEHSDAIYATCNRLDNNLRQRCESDEQYLTLKSTSNIPDASEIVIDAIIAASCHIL